MPNLKEIEERIIRFREERDWCQFHNPRSLATSISIEAAELLEVFQWCKDDEVTRIAAERLPHIREELGDILIYLIMMAHDLNIDLIEAAAEKVSLNEVRYPIDRAKGKATKYTDLENQ